MPLVEEGWTDNDVVEMTVKAYLGSFKQSGIDTLILGCTHYPLLKKAIRKFMGSGFAWSIPPRKPPKKSSRC